MFDCIGRLFYMLAFNKPSKECVTYCAMNNASRETFNPTQSFS